MKKYQLQYAIEHIETDSSIFDDGTLREGEIFTRENIRLHYLFVPKQDGTFSKKIHLAPGVTFTGAAILATHESSLALETLIEGDKVKSEVKILTLAQDNSSLSVAGSSCVDKPYRKVFTRVDQTNILIGANTRVRGIPTLKIATDDIEGGHSCKVHRLGGEGLFYLMSRGLEKKDAEALLLSGEIYHHLSISLTEKVKEELFHEIIHKLR